MLLSLIHFVTLCVLLMLLLWFLFTRTRYYKLCIKIPGPKPYPVLGNIVQIWKHKKLSVENFIKFTSNYYPMCRVFLFNRCFIYLHDADHINTVLKNEKTISKSVVYEIIIRRFLGNSIFSEPREIWRKYRRIMNPLFSLQILKSYLGVFNEKSLILTDILKDKCDGNVFNVFKFMDLCTLDSVTQTTLGVNMDVQKNNLTSFSWAIENTKILMQKCMVNPMYWSDFIFNHSEVGKLTREVISAMKNFTRKIIENKVKDYSENESDVSDNTDCAKKLGFLDYIFRVPTYKEALTQEDLEDQVNILAIGGSDTTAFTLSACLMLLGLNQDVQKKVVEELRDIFGDNVNRFAEYEDLRRMFYMEQVLKETMRLFPVLFLIGRRAEEDIEVGGYTIPAGTDIAISQFLLHRNPKYFPDPSKFDPERFTPENCNKRNPYCYIPFLSGPRICIGHQYAILQMKVVLSHLLRNFEILPCGSREEMDDVDMLALLSLKNYNIRMKLR